MQAVIFCKEAVRITSEDKKKEQEQNELLAVTGLTAAESARASADAAADKFRVGGYERTRFQDTQAMSGFKDEAFSRGTVRDAATGKRLFRTQAETKSQWCGDWTSHSAEADHVVPLKQVHEQLRDNPFLSESDIREIANSPDNLQVLSRRVNASKRDQSNTDFIGNPGRNAEVSRKGQQNLRQAQDSAQSAINARKYGRTVSNAARTFHNAGLEGAKQSGLAALTMSSIMNIAAVVKGEKEADEAVADTLKAGGAGAVTGYAMSGGLTVLSQTLSNSANELVQSVANSNLPGQIITAVMVVGGSLKRYASGEIDTEELILELGDKGAGFAAGSYGFAVGQAMIPVPIVGGIVGSMMGYALSGTLYGHLRSFLEGGRLAHEERVRVERECREAVKALETFRREIDSAVSRYLTEHITAFNAAFEAMKEVMCIGDADGFIAGANTITRKLGGNVQFENMREFDALMMSGEAFVL